METGFLSKNDSEYFSNDVSYDQSNEFESEGSLFQNFVNDYTNDFDEYRWVIADDDNLIDTSFATLPTESSPQDDFNQLKSLNDWDNNFSTVKIKEEDQNGLLNGRCSDIFPSSPIRRLSSPFDTHLDDQLNPNILLDDLPHESHLFSPSSSSSSASFKIKSEPKDNVDTEEDKEKVKLEETASQYVNHFLPCQVKSEADTVVHFIKTEVEEEVDVDIETVSDSNPVSEDDNFASLCHEMSTSEKVVPACANKCDISQQNEQWASNLKVAPLIIKKTNCHLAVESVPWPRELPSVLTPSTESSALTSKQSSSNKTIIEALPEEIIARIKKSSKKKKIVPVVPAERLPSKGNAHMKDAGLSKTKVREMVIKKQMKTKTAQNDHDYCSTNNGKRLQEETKTDNLQKTFTKPQIAVVVDAFSVTDEDKWVLDNEQKLSEKMLSSAPTASPSPSEASSNARNNWEKNSKRDSGLESGDVSDASESPADKKCPPKFQVPDAESSVCPQTKLEKEDCFVNTVEYAPNDDGCTQVPTSPSPSMTNVANYEQNINEPKKKKLNLDEYRTRRKIARLSSPVKTGTIGEAILSNKWVQRSCKESGSVEKVPLEKDLGAPVCQPEPEVPVKSTEGSKRQRERSRERTRDRYRRRSCSSSSSGSHHRSGSTRGRSRDRKRRRQWSKKRSRNTWSPARSHSGTPHSRSSSGRSRSRSCSRSRSSRSSRYCGRSRSRSRSSYHRRGGSSNRRYSRFTHDRVANRRMDDWSTIERQKQVEERRVIYVGQIEEGTTKAQLRERFQCFGPIVDISLHFRERGDNYGFVTFAYKGDAYKAVENGNNNPTEPRYDICFGGRRAFCKQRYADLDSMSPQTSYSPFHQSRSNESFDNLLRAAKEKLLRSQKNV